MERSLATPSIGYDSAKLRSAARRAPTRWGQPRSVPLVGFLLAAAIIFARRPDLLLHAQMWAEDGRVYFMDVYNIGLKRTIVLPQAGYYQTFSVLVAWIARLFPLTAAPFVMALLALAVQALPVGLLLSRRAEAFCPDIRIRAVIAAIYVILPNNSELDATMVNAQWFLAVAALIVLLLGPPRRRATRAGDAVVLALSGLTGPFALVLAPIAWLRRYTRGDDHVRLWEALGLSACFLLQLAALTIISHHDATNPYVEPRPDPSLGATPGLFAKMVGGRVLLGTFLGEDSGMTATPVLQWCAIALAVVVALWVLRSRRFDVLAVLVLGAFTLGGALLHPSAPSPAWPALAVVPVGTQRYFFLAEFAWAIALVWVAARAGLLILRLAAAAALVAVVLVAAIGHWSFPSVAPDGFSAAAHSFDRARAGTTMTIPTEPSGWSMSLLKR